MDTIKSELLAAKETLKQRERDLVDAQQQAADDRRDALAIKDTEIKKLKVSARQFPLFDLQHRRHLKSLLGFSSLIFSIFLSLRQDFYTG